MASVSMIILMKDRLKIFKKNKSKNIQHNEKRSRSSEGLFLHHIDENKIANLSDLRVIRKNPFFSFQKRDRLVYCNYLEHLILHAAIVKETNGKLSIGGYNTIYTPLYKLYSEEKNGRINEMSDKDRRNLNAVGLESDNLREVLVSLDKLVESYK